MAALRASSTPSQADQYIGDWLESPTPATEFYSPGFVPVGNGNTSNMASSAPLAALGTPAGFVAAKLLSASSASSYTDTSAAAGIADGLYRSVGRHVLGAIRIAVARAAARRRGRQLPEYGRQRGLDAVAQCQRVYP